MASYHKVQWEECHCLLLALIMECLIPHYQQSLTGDHRSIGSLKLEKTTTDPSPHAHKPCPLVSHLVCYWMPPRMVIPTTSLGSLFQFLIALSFFLISNQNFPWQNLRPLPIVATTSLFLQWRLWFSWRRVSFSPTSTIRPREVLRVSDYL